MGERGELSGDTAKGANPLDNTEDEAGMVVAVLLIVFTLVLGWYTREAPTNDKCEWLEGTPRAEPAEEDDVDGEGGSAGMAAADDEAFANPLILDSEC